MNGWKHGRYFCREAGVREGDAGEVTIGDNRLAGHIGRRPVPGARERGHPSRAEGEVGSGCRAPHAALARDLPLPESIFSLPGDASAIFDGFNRKVPEAEIVIESLTWLARPFFIFDIRVSDEEVRRRLALRKEVEGRTDDSAVGMRLKEYYEHSEPVIDLFRKAGTLIEINGEQTPEKIAIDIRAALTSK